MVSVFLATTALTNNSLYKKSVKDAGFCQKLSQASLDLDTPGCISDENFSTVFPFGLTVGDGDLDLNPLDGNGAKWTSSGVIKDFLSDGGPPSVLRIDLLNPLVTSSGVFGGQLVAAKLNVEFSLAGVFPTLGPVPITDLVYDNPGHPLDGFTIADIIAIADIAISGLPTPYSIPDINLALSDFNEAFVDGTTSTGKYDLP